MRTEGGGGVFPLGFAIPLCQWRFRPCLPHEIPSAVPAHQPVIGRRDSGNRHRLPHPQPSPCDTLGFLNVPARVQYLSTRLVEGHLSPPNAAKRVPQNLDEWAACRPSQSP